ncbi:MAG: hypothetical protein E7418_05775, partial [Ruminococcaceae bacterium]|nr:hypothetical protein [Oscillospiraceae bacterium]
MTKKLFVIILCLFTALQTMPAFSVEETADASGTIMAEKTAFVSEINNAVSAAEIQELISQKSDWSFEADMEGIFYPLSVYGGLADRCFSSLEAFKESFASLAAAEKQSPKVNLLCQGASVAKMQSGEHTVEIAPMAKDGITLVAAAYEGGKLAACDVKSGSATEKTTLDLGNITTQDATCRVFLWESLDSLKPVDAYNAFYNKATEIFVSSQAADGGDGTREKPFKTIEEAKEYVRTLTPTQNVDIVVSILDDVHYINEPVSFTEADSGNNGYEVIYRGANQASPAMISGGALVSGWESAGGNIYKAHTPEVAEARQFYVDGFAAERAKSHGYYIAEKRYELTETESINLEFEDFAPTGKVYANEVASGEKVYVSTWTTTDPALSIPFHVAKGGAYDATFKIGCAVGKLGSYSRIKIYLDGNLVADNTATDGTLIEGYEGVYDNNLNLAMPVHAYNKTGLSLTAGEHTLVVEVDKVSGAPAGQYTFIMDNAVFKPQEGYALEEKPYLGTAGEEIEVEFEDYAPSGRVHPNEIASSKKVYASAWTTTNPALSIPLHVAEGGTYDATFKIGYAGKTLGSHSKIEIYLDGVMVADNTAGGGTLIEGYEGTYGGLNLSMPVHAYKKTGLSLTAGEHTLVVEVDKVLGAPAGQYTFIMDNAVFTPAAAEQGFYLSGYDLPHFAHPEELEIVAPLLWAQHRLPVRNVEQLALEDRYLFTMDQPYYQAYINMVAESEIQPQVGLWFYLENALELLDEPGEFYYDKTNRYVYYYPHSEEELSKPAYLPVSEGLISVAGSTAESAVRNLRFTNLDFRYGAYNKVTETGLANFQADCYMDFTDGKAAHTTGFTIPGQISIDNAENISVFKCRFSCLGSAAISVTEGAADILIAENAVSDISGTAFVVGSWRYNASSAAETFCDGVSIVNNNICRVGQEFMSSPGIGVYYAKNVDIMSNVITDVPYSGISIGWGWGSTLPVSKDCGGHRIYSNYIEKSSMFGRDGGDIYTNGSFPESGISICENYLIECQNYGSVYMDSGASYGNITIEKNVIDNVVSQNGAEKQYNWVRGNNSNNVVRNNFVAADVEVLSNAELATGTTLINPEMLSGEAKVLADNAGLSPTLRSTLTVPERSAGRKTAYDFLAPVEITASSDILLEAENHNDTVLTGYFAGYANGSYLAPNLVSRGKYRKVIAGFENSMWYKYDFAAPKAGRYRVELRYSTGTGATTAAKATVALARGTSSISGYSLPATRTSTDAHVSVRIGEITLPAG